MITNPETQEKTGVFGTGTMPVLAIVDPELMTSVPSAFKAYQGFDALFHSTEGYISANRNEFSKMVAAEAIKNVSRNLVTSIREPENIEAMSNVAFGSYLSGIQMTVGTCVSAHPLEHALSAYHEKLPHGAGLIMISKAFYSFFINKHVCDDRFIEMAKLMGMEASSGDLFQKLYTKSLEGDLDCGGLLAYGYYSGENITMLNEGRLAFLRTAESKFNLANFMKVNLYTSLGAVKMGLDILMDDEKVKVEKIMGHGGFFKTKGVGQRYLAAAVGAPVTVMDTASEGGAWGIALLAAYLADKKDGEKLEDFLDNRIFKELSGETIEPAKEEIDGFDAFMDHYKAGLEIEKSAIEHMKW